MIRLLVGLGNPGPEYEATRHNAGFWWIDAVARRLGAHLSADKAYHGLVARVNRPAGPIWLIEPQTYMNLSGKSVAPLARFFRIAPEEILVVHDELDVLPGQMKLKQGGSAAGHNGLKDIQAQLGSPAFWRLRLGIGRAIIGMVVAEFFTAVTGLGGLIVFFANSFATAKLFVPIIVIGLLGVFTSEAISILERRLLAWRELDID